MPIYDVEIPGKGSFEVESPTELSDEQAYAAVLQQLNVPKPERSWGEALITDPLASIASGIGGVAQLPGQIGQLAGLVRPEETTTGLMGAGKELQAWAEKQKSEALKQKQAALQADVAKQEGFFNEASTAIKGTLTDPALLSSFLLEQVPNMIGGLGGGMITKGAVKTLLADATETALQKAAVRGAVSTNAVMQGADVGSGTYEQTYQNLIDKGVDPTKANEQALTAAREAALGAATVSIAAQGIVPGGTTLERAFLGRGLPRTGGFAKGFMGEGASEAFEEGAGQFLSNLAQSQYVPETDLMKGVGQAAGLGGVLGGVMGGGAGITMRGQPTVAPTEAPAPAAPEEVAPTPALEDRAFKPVVFPDGSVAYTPEQVQQYEQQQFEQRFTPEVQFAEQLQAEREAEAVRQKEFADLQAQRQQVATEMQAVDAEQTALNENLQGKVLTPKEEKIAANLQRQLEQRRVAAEKEAAKVANQERRALLKAEQQQLPLPVPPTEIKPTPVEGQPDLFEPARPAAPETAPEITPLTPTAPIEKLPVQEAVQSSQEAEYRAQLPESENGWVVVDKETGKPQFESNVGGSVIDYVNSGKYEAVPINQYRTNVQQAFAEKVAASTVSDEVAMKKAEEVSSLLKKAYPQGGIKQFTNEELSYFVKGNGVAAADNTIATLKKTISENKKRQKKLQLRAGPEQFTPAMQQSAATIRAELSPFLDKIGLGSVGLRLVNSINNGTADGAYFRNVIEIALDAKNAMATLRHETIHALKELGVFTPAEWNYLSKEAQTKWIKEFISPEKQTQYREQYVKDNGSEQGFDSYLQEEAIAEAFRSYGDKPKAGALKRIVNKLKAFFEATGNWLRGNGFNSVDSIFSGIEAGRYAPTEAAAAEVKPAEAPKYQLKNAPPKRTTKLGEAETAGKAAMAGAQEAWSHIAEQEKRTSLRMKFVDVSASLADRLAKAGMPVYDETGRLRADMLNHAKNQAINLIKNMMISGQPMVNTDGTLGIERSDKTLARSQQLADELDNNQFVKDSGLSGRAFVAEVARALRGKDILADDVRRNAKGRRQLEEAKARYKEAKAAAAAGKHKMYKELMRQVAELRRDGYKNKNLKREKVVDKANIEWAEKQLKNVPEVEQILNIWRVNNHALVNLWEQVGLLTAEQADEYRSNVHYVPLFKSAEDLNEDRAFPRAGVGGKSTPKMHKLEGGMHEVNVWENIDKQFARMVALAYENQTRSFAAEQLVGVGGAYETNRSDPNVNLRFKRNGRDVHLVAENPNDVAAFQSMGFQLGPIMKAFAAGTKVLRYGALINPMFWMRQLIRDPIHATMVTNTMVTPFHSAAEFAKILLRNESDAYRTLVERGVIGEVGSTMSIDEFIRTVGTEADKKPGKLHNMLHRLMQIHESSDAATRVAIYEAALKKAKAQGMSDAKAKDYAVYTAREAINFSVQGNNPVLANLRAMIPFLSASITSLDTVYKAATGYGLNAAEKKQVQQLFMRRAMIFTAMTLAYAMMYQDDDDYKNVPDYIRDNNWLIPMASPSEPGKKVFIKVPLPFEIGFLLKTIPEASIRYMAGTSTGKEVMASYMSGLSHNLPSNGILIPQLAKPILENITNHSFYTGKPIESLGEQRLPAAMRGTGASEFAKQLGGATGFSPKMIDNLINGYFAEAGTSAAGIASYMIHAATGTKPPSKNFEEIWGIKSFVTSPNTSKAIADFYQIDGQAQQTVNEFNELKKSGDYKAIEAFAQDEDKMRQVAAQKSLNRIGDAMGKIRAQIRLIERNQAMSPEERRQLINQLQQQQAVLAQTGVSIAEQIGVR